MTPYWPDILNPVLTAILTAGLLALMYYFIPTRAEKLSKKRSAALLASHLELFAIECADLLADFQNYQGSGGHLGQTPNFIPSLKELPKSIDLSIIPPTILSEALAIHNMITLSQKVAAGSFALSLDEEEFMERVTKSTAVIGNRAKNIAVEIRQYAGLPLPDYSKVIWDFGEYLERTANEYDRVKISNSKQE